MSLRLFFFGCLHAGILACAGPATTRAADSDTSSATLQTAVPAPSVPPLANPLRGDAADLVSPVAYASGAAPSTPPLPPEPKAETPSENVTINLIHLMVKRGLISKDDSADLIKQAETEAVNAREQAIVATAGGLPSSESAAGTSAASGGGGPSGEDDTVRVAYVPQVVKEQIRDEVKADLMKENRTEIAASPKAEEKYPRFRVSGDLRTRYDGNFFPSGNDNTGAFPNFNAINTGAPNDLLNLNSRPEYDVDQDRNRFRLRARIGTEVDLVQNFMVGLRLGTGSDNSPVTQNQTLGGANNGQGGDFSKYAIWLDRAFLRYQVGRLEQNLAVTVGRFDNPFFGTSMIWADDIGFDGLVAKAKYQVDDGLVPFATAGVFPVFNTDLNFATTSPAKFKSEDKWLYGLQVGTNWKINQDFHATVAASLYYFDNLAGRLSTPFIPLSATDQGDTDDTRPSFAQNGNTYRALRDIDNSTAANNFGNSDQFQYYGLGTNYDELAFTGQIDFGRFDPFHLWLVGEVVKNLAFDKGATSDVAINNRGAGEGFPPYEGGDTGYNVKLNVGKAALEALWDWNVNVGYRYVESDAVVDGFTDSDFGGPLAGTNLQGYTLEGNLAFSPNIWARLRFMSADAIAGPPYKNDLIQVDLNAKF